MSLIKKADVENYFSGRRKKIVFPFGPLKQPGINGYSGDGHRDTNPNVPGTGGPVGALAVKKPQV